MNAARSATFALFTRSLREDTRKATPYFARMGLATIILLFLAMSHMSMRFSASSTAGLQFFTMVIWINVVFFTIVGLSHFSSAITEEKEEMTLGLLRMTNLNPLSILLGKSTNRLFVALLYLAAQFPFTLLAVTLGGVSNAQIIAAYVALAAYVVLLANLALFFSVVCRRTYSAAFFSFVTLAVSVTGIWIGYGIVELLTNIGVLQGMDTFAASIPKRLAEATIAFRLNDVLTTGFNEGPLCSQVYSNMAVAAVLFFLSWMFFDRATRNQLGTDSGPTRPVGTAKSAKGGKRRLLAPGRPGLSAVFWKDWHFLHNGKVGAYLRTGMLMALFFLVIPGFVILVEAQTTRRRLRLDQLLDELGDYGWTIFWISFGLLVLQLGLLAGRIFRDEIRWQTLSSLAMLPLSMRRIAYQKVAAAIVVVLPTVAFMLFGFIVELDDFLGFLEQIGRFDSGEAVAAFFSAILYAIAQILLGVHVIAWLSLRLKWGAFALGVFVMIIANMTYWMILATGMFSSGQELFIAVLIFGALGAIAISAGLHNAIGDGLKAAAAKE